MNWKPASLVFEGGTEEVRALIGHRVRARRDVQLFSFLGSEARNPLGPPVKMARGEMAFVANPYETMVVLALPGAKASLPDTLKALTSKGNFRVLCADWSELRTSFDIEL